MTYICMPAACPCGLLAAAVVQSSCSVACVQKSDGGTPNASLRSNQVGQVRTEAIFLCSLHENSVHPASEPDFITHVCIVAYS